MAVIVFVIVCYIIGKLWSLRNAQSAPKTGDVPKNSTESKAPADTVEEGYATKAATAAKETALAFRNMARDGQRACKVE